MDEVAYEYSQISIIRLLSRVRIIENMNINEPRIKLDNLGPVHTKTIVNANASKRKLFYVFRPSVHTKTMKTHKFENALQSE